jgi:hypothetical protein
MAKSWHKNFKRSKKIERTDVDGTVFDSKGELRRWKKLQQWQLAGEIRHLRRQVSYELVVLGCRPILTPTGKTALYVADFVYERRVFLSEISHGYPGGKWVWQEVIEDFKGYQSRENAFKIAVFEALHGRKVTLSRNAK